MHKLDLKYTDFIYGIYIQKETMLMTANYD